MKGVAEIKSAGLGCFPCLQNKHPMVERGQDWRAAAFLPEDQLEKSNIWGLLVPSRILIIDLDLYDGITREDADKVLGCKLPWDQSLIQKTQSGGEHHAFLVDFGDYPANISQRNGYPIKGLDTKIVGKGYICLGHKYTEMGSGIIGLSNPDRFPRLPDAAYEVLKRDNHQHNLAPPPTMKADIDIGRLKEALKNIDPEGSRDLWRNVGFGLKHGFGNDPKGFELWNQWSRGDFHGNGTPEKYKNKEMIWQWSSFKQYVPGGVTISSIYHYAGMTSPHEQMSMDEISKLVGWTEPVEPSSHLPTIIHVDKIPAQVIEDHPIIISDNARIKPKHPWLVDKRCVFEILKGEYKGRLQKFDGSPRWWSGREWEYLGETDLINFITDSLPERYGSTVRIKQIHKMFLYRMPKIKTPKPSKKVFFLDGVLDLYSGKFVQHNKNNYNIGTLSVNYRDKGMTVEWIKFSISTLEEDEIKLLQEIMGFFLVHHNLGIEKYIAFTGVTRAGKGIILRILRAILGSGFCGSFNFSTLGTPQGHDALWKHQVLIDPEAKAPKREEKVSTLQTIQKVTSNEPISSRVLYNNEYKEGIVNCKLIIACNNLPIFSDDSGASASRIEILKFSKSFLGKEDKQLYKRLEKELSGITHWAIEGLQRLIANNGVFTKPRSSIEEMEDLKNLSKPLNGFIEDYLIFYSEYKVSTDNLYSAYKLHCEKNKMRIWSETMFRKRLKNTLLNEDVKPCRYRVNGVRTQGFEGVKIIDSVFVGILGVSPSSAPLPPTPMKDK